jgi:hypothetical protein
MWIRTTTGQHVVFGRALIRKVRPVGWMSVVVTAFIAIVSVWRDEGPANRQPPLLSDIFTWLPWWVWLLVMMSVIILIVFEGGYRLVMDKEAENEQVKAQLTQKRDQLEQFFSELAADGRNLKWRIENRWESGLENSVKVWAFGVEENLEEQRPSFVEPFWADGFPNIPVPDDWVPERKRAYRQITIRLWRLKEEVLDKLNAERH